MARTCKECGLNLDKFAEPGSDKHRCVGGKFVRKPTKLEADKIARGEMSLADLAQEQKPAASTQPAGRLAPRTPYDRTTPQSRQPQPTNAELLAAIEGLRAQFEKLAAVVKLPRTDA